jgi:hypothetical protein
LNELGIGVPVSFDEEAPLFTGSLRKMPSVPILELGEHEIAQGLRALNLGRVLHYQYCPQTQAILTPVFESYAA